MRVFTRDTQGGNHLGVVTDIVGLDGDTMQTIATDLGFSETVFVDWQAQAIPELRIFTPAEELPFAGHPLVGTGWVLNSMGPGGVATLRCRAGEMEVRLDGTTTWIESPMLGEVVADDDATGFVSRTGLQGAIDVSRVVGPLDYVLVELATPADVVAASVDIRVVSERFGMMAWAMAGDQVKVRFFDPGAAVDEDPATGSAAMAFARLLLHRGATAGEVTISQGDEIGYPSTIRLTWGNGRVAIGGTVIHDETRMLDS